jgi:hypothetical protein
MPLKRCLQGNFNGCAIVTNRHPFDDKPVVIADSAFGTDEVRKAIDNWGGLGVLSFRPSIHEWLWVTLSHNVPPGNYRAARAPDPDGWIASASVGVVDEGKVMYKNVFTSLFSGSAVHLEPNNASNAVNGTIYLSIIILFNRNSWRLHPCVYSRHFGQNEKY